MLQAARRSTIPLDRDATGRFLPFIIAIMVLLASLMLCAALMLGQGLSGWRSSLDLRATVQIMPLDERASPLPERVEAALAILRTAPQVTSASQVTEDEMSRLLAPWLGEGALPPDLPVPVLIDVQLKEQADLAPLQEQLKAIAGAQLDDHGSWLKEVRRIARLSIASAYVMVLLIAGAAALILVLLVRAGLNMHRDVVELLHLVGATDRFIAAQFQRHMLLVAAEGAAIGVFSALLLLWLFASMAAKADHAVHVPWLAVPLVAAGFVVLAGVTTQRTASRLISELP